MTDQEAQELFDSIKIPIYARFGDDAEDRIVGHEPVRPGDFARAILARFGGHHAPVPVSERLPGPEDCDAEGCIWLWDTDRRWVRQCRDAAASNSWIGSSWLPGYALPLPAEEVQ
jgi:hypothetical protein